MFYIDDASKQNLSLNSQFQKQGQGGILCCVTMKCKESGHDMCLCSQVKPKIDIWNIKKKESLSILYGIHSVQIYESKL